MALAAALLAFAVPAQDPEFLIILALHRQSKGRLCVRGSAVIGGATGVRTCTSHTKSWICFCPLLSRFGLSRSRFSACAFALVARAALLAAACCCFVAACFSLAARARSSAACARTLFHWTTKAHKGDTGCSGCSRQQGGCSTGGAVPHHVCNGHAGLGLPQAKHTHAACSCVPTDLRNLLRPLALL